MRSSLTTARVGRFPWTAADAHVGLRGGYAGRTGPGSQRQDRLYTKLNRKLASALVAIASFATAQTTDSSPQFEVASIKPAPPPGSGRVRIGSGGGPGTSDPGLFTCERCSVHGLLCQAFVLQDYQISGPDWIRSAQFNISAKIPEGTNREQFHLMLRNLLATRFQLQTHREKKETQAYELIVAKSGLKIKGSAGPVDPEERPARLTERALDSEGFAILPPGRVSMAMMMMGGKTTMRRTDQTMEQFATILANRLGHPVTNATGLKGKYDFTIKWIEESAGPPSSDDSGPNIFMALQEQLGLKLESKKTMVDILIVDHVEKAPTEN